MTKYKNIKTILDGIKFDSKKEANRYNELKLLERANKISNLKLQVPFELIPKQKDELKVTYKADFMYFDKELNEWIVEDVKGVKTKDYIIKRKLFKHKYKDYLFLET